MNYLSATIVVIDPRTATGFGFLKYHGIPNREPDIVRFMKFAVVKGVASGTPAKYVNFYEAWGKKKFKFQRYCG